MSDIIISVERIKSVEAHPQADRLEVAKILGTQCVVPKGEYKAGDSVVYFPPDMVLPGDVSLQLGVQKYLKHSLVEGLKIPSRVAACRLRTVASFGFIAKLPTELSHLAGWVGTEQANVTEFYRGFKYEPPVVPRVGGGAMWGGMAPEHPMFHQYTDIQNHYRYPDAIPTGTIVRVTEKIHGCLRAQTRITMADGSKKKIIDVIAGDYVLGGWNGQVVPTRVTNTFNNGPTDRWLIVTTERRGAGRGGNAFARLRCTPNHRYWSPTLSDYIAAESLTPGDSVSVLRIDPDLTPLLVTQKVLSIQEEICPRANRYDIETETHNYFANGVLTHNSNSRVGVVYHEGEFVFMAGSHKKNRKKEFEGVQSVYWKPLEIEGVLNMLNTLCDGRRNIVVFGEIYGPGVQDTDYGIPAGDIGYRVFDITDDGDYLDWDIVKAMCDNNQVELVPLLYKGPFSQKMVEELTSGPTTLVTPEGIKSKFKGREGIVITPVVEAYSEILGGRMILKSKSADFLDRKNAEDNGE